MKDTKHISQGTVRKVILFHFFMQIGHNIILFDSSYEVLLSSMAANHEDSSGQGYSVVILSTCRERAACKVNMIAKRKGASRQILIRDLS